MLKQKSSEVTQQILRSLQIETIAFTFITINPIILKALEAVYIRSRQDKDNDIHFELLADGSIIFENEQN